MKMFKPSPRSLLVAASLLLVPLGALKWRADQRREWLADHPPLSRTDKYLRDIIGKASFVYIQGGGTLWKQLSDAQGTSPTIYDKAAFRAIPETLRCVELEEAPPVTSDKGTITLSANGTITLIVGHLDPFETTPLIYWHDEQGAYLGGTTMEAKPVAVLPRFAPRFEALLSRLLHQDWRKHPVAVRSPAP